MTSATRSAYIVHTGSPFKDTEPVDEVNHKVATQCIVFRILGIAVICGLRNIAALVQDIIDLETQCRLVTFQERFGCRCVP